MPNKNGEREGAKFVRYFGPVLDALRQLDGSGTPSEVTNKVAENLNIPETQQTELLKSGSPRFANQVAWARNYLKLEGYIDSSKKGVWVLTEAGYKAHLSAEDARKLFSKWVAIHQGQRQEKGRKQERGKSACVALRRGGKKSERYSSAERSLDARTP